MFADAALLACEIKGVSVEEKNEYLDEKLEDAYRQSEFDELCSYFVAVRKGLQVADPRPRMSFITRELEDKAESYASCLSDVMEEFDGTMEEEV